MKKYIKILNSSNKRVLVDYDLLNNTINFFGQYKPHNKEWMDVSLITLNGHAEINDYSKINRIIKDVIEFMNNKIELYNDFIKVLDLFTNIEYKESN